MSETLKSLRLNIPVWQLLALGSGSLLITVYAAAVGWCGYVPPVNISLFGTNPQIMILVGVAFVYYKFQQRLSAAHGGERVAEVLVSLPMLVVAGAAFALWFRLPGVESVLGRITSWFGVTLSTLPNDYQVNSMTIFGIAALWDVVIRDLLGIGRLSVTLDSRVSGGFLKVYLEPNYVVKNKRTDEEIPVTNVPSEVEDRFYAYLKVQASEAKTPTA